MLDRFMDNYSTWETTAQFNFACIVIGLGFLLTILFGIWSSYVWSKFMHYQAVRKVGWPLPVPSVAPVAQAAPEPEHRVDVKAVQMTTYGKDAEAKLIGTVQQTLTQEGENGDVRTESSGRSPARRLQTSK